MQSEFIRRLHKAGIVQRIAALCMTASMLQACSTPIAHAYRLASESGFTHSVRLGIAFEHVVFENRAAERTDVLRIYIEGDGTPYLDRSTVAADPTPRNPLMLRLMALDPAPAVYLGRPCYFGFATDPPCSPTDWTIGRFSERVVASMAHVIEELQRERGAIALELYGHSGGGALAVLLAARLTNVSRVVTLSGNLDTSAWTTYHDYTPLSESLNPVDEGPLPPSIVQLHVAAERDKVVPAWIVRAAVPRLGHGEFAVLPAASHTCCWAQAWRRYLDGER